MVNYNTELAELGISGAALNDLNKQSIYTLGELLRVVDKKTITKTNKLDAVRELSGLTGLSLREAKNIIDLCGFPLKDWKQPSRNNPQAINYGTELTALKIPTEKLNILQQQAIYTVGELLEAVDQTVPLKDDEAAFIKKLEEWTDLNSKECTVLVNLGLPPKLSTNNGDDPSDMEELMESIAADYYLNFPDILTELGKGIVQAQQELNTQSIEVQNFILKNKELADSGLNATWYTMPDIQFRLLMEYSINEKTTMEGMIKRTRKKIGIIPSNVRYDILFESERKEESEFIVKFKQVPPPPMKITRTEVPNLLGMTKKEAEISLRETEINAIFEQEMESDNVSEMKVVRQNVNPGDFLLEGELLTVFLNDI
jgi:Uncharacterized protein conserved in bacteria